jgi:ergothioneine biosynthesis protein EgtB
VTAEGWESPLYWAEASGGWQEFTLGGPIMVNPSQPVCHISYYEADAFARWAGCRLPTESEWEVAAAGASIEGHFLDQKRLHPSPVTSVTESGPENGLFGNVWQWTSSAYSPYPGFEVAPGAVGEYNGKFMVNQYVLRGGSCVTPPGHIRASYRNFFPPSARWAFSGLRLARNI